VLFPIEEHINQDIANITRRLQRARMIAVREDAAARRKQSVHTTGDPHGESFHALTEAPSVVCFDNQMDVVRLYAVVHDAEKATLRLVKLGNNTAMERLAAQTRQAVANPNRDMQRMVSAMDRSPQVRNPGAPAPRFAPRTPAPAPPCIAKRKLDLGCHLNRLTYFERDGNRWQSIAKRLRAAASESVSPD
jgi:hypothetical protein